MLAVIFANGVFSPPSDLQARLATAGLIIAADGGAQHCRALDLWPQVVIGDLDSLDAATRGELETQGTQILIHPAEKDETDLELALHHAKAAGAQEVILLGGLGRRWDHSLANLLLAASPAFLHLGILFLHGEQRLFVIHAGVELEAKVGERVSLIPLAGDAHGVNTTGLEYPLNSETLLFGSSRGVSNIVRQDKATVDLSSGLLLCVISPGDLD